MNSFSELEEPYLRVLRDTCADAGVTITSVHPFTSGYEYMLFFSAYPKRAADSLEIYHKYFHAAAYLGAAYTVFHGDAVHAPFFGMDNYCEVLAMLMEAAKRDGCTLAHENVSSARAGDPAFMSELHERFGEGKIKFVFDLKQTVRGGYDPFEMIRVMGSDIVHVHINDFAGGECRLPFAGELPVDRVIDSIEGTGYRGRYMVEVYRKNFGEDDEIIAAVDRLRAL